MLWHRGPAYRAAIICSLCAAVGVSLALPVAAGNLIRNGRFEEPATEGVPQNWSFHNWRQDELASGEVTAGGNVGPHCLRLSSPVFPADFAAYCRPVDVSAWAGREMLITCYYHTIKHPQAQVAIATYAEPFTLKEFETPQLQSEAFPLGESAHWRLATWRFTCKPHSKELVVLLHLMGEGEVFFDGVTARPVGGEIEVELEQAGTITAMPHLRSVRCRLHNRTEAAKLVKINLEATVPGAGTVPAVAQCTLAPNQQEELTASYALDFRQAHELRITVVGAEPDEVYQAYHRSVSGLVSARIIEPAFRSCLLSGIPTDEIVVEGRLNASEEIARGTQLSATLLGTGTSSSEVIPLSDDGVLGPWHIALSTEGMLTGDHEVQVKARTAPGLEHVLSLPLSRAPQADLQVAYDARHRLWVHGQPIFPIGICRVTDDRELPAMREAGFNFVITPSRVVSYAYADAAQEAGMRIAISSSSLDTEIFWLLLRDKYFQHPALLGWYALERPDMQGAFPNVVGEIYSDLAALDPHHPILLALRPNSSLPGFAEACDIVVVWTEPVPRWPISTVADDVQRAIQATGGHKPVWAMIQSTGLAWSQDASLKQQTTGRAPTAAEHRAMVYLALMSGADGIAYYSYRLPARQGLPPYDIRRDAPELWESIKETNSQLIWLAPVLSNASPEPIELPEDSPIRIAAFEYEGASYIVAVNPGASATAISFDLGAGPHQELPVLFERRTLVASETGRLADVFDPCAVHVYLKKG